MQALFIHWLQLPASDWIIQSVICCSEVSMALAGVCQCCAISMSMSFYWLFSVSLSSNSVCLRNLHDHGNAFLAFERSVMLPDAVKYPLIYLNFAIYCVQMKRYELAGMYLGNFFSVSEHTTVRHEVSVTQFNCKRTIHAHFVLSISNPVQSDC